MVRSTLHPLGNRARRDARVGRDCVEDRQTGSRREEGSDVPTFTQLGAEDEGRLQPRILLPYSGSATARLALDFIEGAAFATSAEVWLLYVRIFDVARGGCYYLETPVQARACARRAALRLRTSGVACSYVTRNARRDKVVRTILAEAEALDATMIVLGARDRRPIAAAILGSTSRGVARRSPRRVVLVKR